MLEILLKSEKLGEINGFPITNTLVNSVLVMLFLVLCAVSLSATGHNLKSRFYNFAEMLIGGLMSVIESVLGRGKMARQVFAVISTFFLFIMLNNWFGIFPGTGSLGFWQEHSIEERAATPEAAEEEAKWVFVPLLRSANSDLNMTLAVALVSVFFIQFTAIRNIGLKSYLGKFFNFKSPILFFVGLLEIISEFVKIVSFSFRLFGNIFAGDVLLIVISSLVPFIAPIPFLGVEMFAGFVQALVFSMLTLVFIKVSATAHSGH